MKFTCKRYPKLHIGLRIAFDGGVYETADEAEIASILAFSAKYGIEYDAAEAESLDSLFTGLKSSADTTDTTASEPEKVEKDENEEGEEGKEEGAGDAGEVAEGDDQGDQDGGADSNAFTREELAAMTVPVIKNHAAVKGILLDGTKKDELIDSFIAKQGE
ncbi:hypothetical protein LF599_07500 [Pseudodesulfovibrio thermohalotolerans]|uniref:hypothetical protein n=1 Tax=Pseudodesulfovibrio thermohalotolerans TaxID=2880651 RepID=UPI0022B9EC06|nr:hypothetical protein [Pseudodesulfovibrio thermohalotolerans]WFS64000.1 hypothetical protein LF599_07500 [Pseudodesulfovibrio thermohalotolerans]